MRKRASSGLPTAFTQPLVADGSVKSIKVEAPLAKAIRSADGFIKGTYLWLLISIIFIWGGWSWIARNSASIVLDCTSSGCTLTVKTPYRFLPRNSDSGISVKRKRNQRKTKIEFNRDQLVRADNIKWDPEYQQIVKNYGLNSPTYASEQKKEDEEYEGENKPYNKRQKKKQKNKKYSTNRSYNRNGGPDEDGNYDSFVLVLRDPLPSSSESDEVGINPDESPSMRMARQMATQHNTMARDPNSLTSLLAPFAITNIPNRESSTSMEYFIHPRDFNLGQTRRLARTAVSKINAYTKGRRASCILRESRPVSWQGLILLILGIFSFVLCLLLGQFWEQHDPTKVGSYRKRMAEMRKREAAKKVRLRKSAVRKAPSFRTTQSTTHNTERAGRSVSNTPSTGSARMRSNAGANVTQGGDSWVGSGGGAAHGYAKRRI